MLFFNIDDKSQSYKWWNVMDCIIEIIIVIENGWNVGGVMRKVAQNAMHVEYLKVTQSHTKMIIESFK